MKNVLVVYGSPKKNGNSYAETQKVLKKYEGLNITEIFANEQNVNFCKGCGECKGGKCSHDDDMKKIIELIFDADIIILASPLYFGSVSAQLKVIIDRCQAIFLPKILKISDIVNKQRLGVFVCTAGAVNPEFCGAVNVADLFFKTVNALFIKKVLVDATDFN